LPTEVDFFNVGAPAKGNENERRAAARPRREGRCLRWHYREILARRGGEKSHGHPKSHKDPATSRSGPVSRSKSPSNFFEKSPSRGGLITERGKKSGHGPRVQGEMLTAIGTSRKRREGGAMKLWGVGQGPQPSRKMLYRGKSVRSGKTKATRNQVLREQSRAGRGGSD